MYDQYDIGETATLQVTCLNTAGALAAPILLALVITHPDGTQDTLAIGDLTLVSTGLYTYDVALDADGVWTYTFTAQGNDVNFTTTEYLLVGIDTRASGPCDLWIGPADVFALKPASDVAAADRNWGLADECAQAASRLLYILSRSRYPGICREVVRPCRRSEAWTTPPRWWWWNESWGYCTCQSPSSRACGCSRLDEIQLGAEPVLAIAEVRIDGAILAPSAYRVDDSRWLVRVDGEGWPCCQDLTASPLTDDNTFQVTFFAGRTPPADGILAAKRLAGDLYQGLTGGDCALPANVQSLVRRGVDLEFASPSGELEQGLTALREVDLFLHAERWQAAHRQSLTVSPDSLPQVRRVGT